VTILCYHAVDPDWRSPLAVTPDAFDQHCAWLAGHRRVLDLDDAAGHLDGKGRLPRGTTAITFDDGFRGLYEHALPVLQRHRLAATVFVVAETLAPGGRAVDWVDTPPADGSPLETLTLDEALALRDAGIRIESHSYSHRVLTELGEEECERDLRASRDLLEDLLGGPVRHLAYPRGFHDDRVRAAAARAGFRNSYTLPEGPEAVGPQAIPRVGIYPGNDVRTLRWKLSRPYLPLRTSGVYPTVRRLLKGEPPPTRRAG
jgi:peptidoglycan/xylan/chitin deacetylase (PgdA/CDA1 family)